MVSDGDFEVGNVQKAAFALHLIVHSPCTRSHTSHHFTLSTASAGRLFLTHFYPHFTDEDTTDLENLEIYLTSQRGQAGARIQTQVHLGPELSWFRTEDSLSRGLASSAPSIHPPTPPPTQSCIAVLGLESTLLQELILLPCPPLHAPPQCAILIELTSNIVPWSCSMQRPCLYFSRRLHPPIPNSHPSPPVGLWYICLHGPHPPLKKQQHNKQKTCIGTKAG